MLAKIYMNLVALFFASVASAQPTEATPADKADKVARSLGGRLIRIVGVHYDRNAIPQDSALGNVVEVGETDFTPESLCHVLLKGLSVKDESTGRMVPYIPELLTAFGKASWPVELTGSCRADGCYYIALLNADDCLKAADADGYHGSTMHEFLELYSGDIEERGRFLRTAGRCVDSRTTLEYFCSVPVSDPRAITGRAVRVPGSWAERRHDLGFASAVDGEVQPRSGAKAKVEVVP